MQDKFSIKESGSNDTFQTGAIRDKQEGKGRFDLMPVHALMRVARVYEEGGKLKGDRNWEKGIPLSRYLDSGIRHTLKVLDGWVDEDHAAMAVWNMLGYIQTKYWIEQGMLPKELDDLPKRA